MKLVIIFPKQFFTPKQLHKLKKHDLQFIEGKNIDLDKLSTLYEGEDFIFSINPAYVKDEWHSLPLSRIEKMKGLKALCLSTTSFSWVDTKTLAKIGITVTNTPGKSTNAVAEFNVFMMLSLLRKLPLIIKNSWKMNYDKFLGTEAAGLTTGIIGLGQIGSKVAELCAAIGMDVYFYNRSKKTSSFKQVSLKQLFKKSDIIFITIATPPELKGFISKKLISSLRKNAMIISTSDTHILDEEFILRQIVSGKLGGYAFESNHKKLRGYRGNVMVFPEQAYYTLNTQRNTARILTDTILSVLRGKPINRVNQLRLIFKDFLPRFVG